MQRTGVEEEVDDTLKDKLLLLIEEGDATVILSSEYIESLNELIKHEFVSVENEGLCLTDRGREAKLLGVKAMLKGTAVIEKEVKINKVPQRKIPSGVSNRSFLILLFFFLVSLLAMISLVNTD